MTTRSTTLLTLAAAISATLAAAAVQALETPAGALEDVVVTAQKRAASLQDVPFSVAAASEEQIRNAGANNIVDLARNVAGLSIADLGPGQSQIAIRGISAGQVIRDQPGVKEQVGVYLDESPISVALFTPDLELFDLERFEVLRGPQGTLFGSGSESGTLRYITRQPKLGAFEGVADMSIEEPKGGNVGGSVRAAVNLPLGDTAAVRFVGYGHHLPGFIEAIQPDGHVIKGVNDGDRTGFRLSMLWKATDRLTVTPRVVFQNLKTNGYPREDVYNILGNPYTTTQPAVTIGDRQQYTQQREGITDDFLLTDLKLSYDLGAAEVTSVTSYTDRKVVVKRDATQLSGSVTFDVYGDVPQVRISSPLYDTTKLKVLSEELRVGSTGKNTLDWLLGGFVQNVDRHYGQDLPTPGYDDMTMNLVPLGRTTPYGITSADLNAPPDTPFYSNLTYKLKQYGLFGEATWHVSDALAATGGVRFYKYTEDRVLNFGGFFADPTPPGGVPASVDSHGVSPRAILSYKIDDDTQFNAQISRGFRLGGINDPINVPLCSAQDIQVFGNQKNWKDETNMNYEVGAKLRFLDRRVTFNVSVFMNEIKDLQATTTAGTCSSRIVFNVPKARTEGLEAELAARPSPNWDFAISATYVDAKLRSSVTSTLPDGSSVVVGGLAEGNQLPTAPKFQGVASAGYTLPLADKGREFFANLTLQYVGSSYSQFENEVANFGNIGGGLPGSARLIGYGDPVIPAGGINFNPQLGSYSLGNVRAGLRTPTWEAALYVNNLWDENAHLAIDYERGRSARVGFLTNQPRTIGFTALYRF